MSAAPAHQLHAVPNTDVGAGWEPPAPLQAVRDLPSFPARVLPGWLADQVAAVAEATQTPVDLPACIALAALSTAAGGRAKVRVRPGWDEQVNIYTVVVMEPSARKSPVFSAMIRPIYTLERQIRENARSAIEEAKVQQRAAETLMQRAEKAAADASGGEREKALQDAVNAALDAANVQVPVDPKLVVDDITPEETASVLANQGGRLAVLSDEGGIFPIIAGRYSGSANTNVFLKGYTGTQLRVNRTGRPAELVETPALTLGLTVQPAVIDELGHTSMLRGSGFLARILYSLPKSLVGQRKARPDPVPEAVETTYHEQLHTIAYTLVDWTDPAILQFSEDADYLAAEMHNDVEAKLADGGSWSHLADWAGKLVGQTVRVAGLLHVATHPHNPWEHPVSGETFTAAWEIADYYAQHALATFDQIGADKTLAGARHLLRWIERIRPTTFTKRDAHNANRAQFPKVADLDPALALLEEHGHIYMQAQPERAPGARGRPPSPAYWTHPTYRQEAP